MTLQTKPMLKALALLFIISSFSFAAISTASFKGKKAKAVITATNQADMPVSGSASFTELKNGQVKMELVLVVPKKANSSVAVHFHEHGDCGDMGNNTHGHWNPTATKHGKWGSAEFHSGDIGNIQLDAKGKGKLTLTSSLWSIGGDEKTNIVNRSIIVHGGVDDYTTQPSGNSGPRIGCGVITMK